MNAENTKQLTKPSKKLTKILDVLLNIFNSFKTPYTYNQRIKYFPFTIERRRKLRAVAKFNENNLKLIKQSIKLKSISAKGFSIYWRGRLKPKLR